MSKISIDGIIHKNSSETVGGGTPKLPTAENLEFGEIAVNYADGVETISLKNTSSDIVTFSSDEATGKKLAAKQDTLVSGTNIKTINGRSVLGEGNIEIQGGSGDGISDAPSDGSIYGRQNGNWSKITIPSTDNFATKSDISDMLTKTEASSTYQTKGDYALKSEIPDVSDFITSSVDNLVNYYKKSEVDSKISAIATLSFTSVAELPQSGESDKIYLVPNAEQTENNVKDEYIWVDGKWEIIGSTKVDLSDYYTKETIDSLLLNKVNVSDYNSDKATFALKTELSNYLTISNAESTYVKKSEAPQEYVLPIASSDTLGGIKVGAGLSINNETGVLSATGGGTADSVDWANITSKPETFPPSEHTHVTADITDLQGKLDAKADKSSISDMLTKTEASSTYLTKTDASATYQPKGNYLTSIPSEYITESELDDKNYATKEELQEKAEEISNVDETYSISPITSGTSAIGTYIINKKDFYVKIEGDESAFTNKTIQISTVTDSGSSAVAVPLNEFYHFTSGSVITKIIVFYGPTTLSKATSVRVIIYKTNDIAESFDEIYTGLTYASNKNTEQDSKISALTANDAEQDSKISDLESVTAKIQYLWPNNLFPDGSFEEGGKANQNVTNSTVSVESSGAMFGSNCLKIACNASGNSWTYLGRGQVEVNPNSVYTIVFWAKANTNLTEAGGACGVFFSKDYELNMATGGFTAFQPKLTTSWQRFAYKATAPSDSKTLALRIGTVSQSPAATIYVDGIMVFEGDLTNSLPDTFVKCANDDLLSSGVDVYNNQISVTTNQFLVKNSSGDVTVKVDSNGALSGSFNGTFSGTSTGTFEGIYKQSPTLINRNNAEDYVTDGTYTNEPIKYASILDLNCFAIRSADSLSSLGDYWSGVQVYFLGYGSNSGNNFGDTDTEGKLSTLCGLIGTTAKFLNLSKWTTSVHYIDSSGDLRATEIPQYGLAVGTLKIANKTSNGKSVIYWDVNVYNV